MKTNHTAGPWTFAGECEPLPVRGSQFQVWEHMANGSRPIAAVVSDEDQSIGVTEGIANAHLIAAAPTLLAALRALADYAQTQYENPNNFTSSVVLDALAAIALATKGNQP